MSKTSTTTFAASDAKNNFGKLIDAAQRGPIAIERRGRPVAYIVSPADMEAAEDFYLGARAVAAMKKGSFLGIKKSEAYLKRVLKRHARN